jgi:EAL domain-containing protein (putative c-di-GMP-specific phosphodiesterase class I)
VIPPDRFISIAEHSGLIRPLTNWVIQETAEQCGQWRALGLDVGIAVNLSVRSLHDPELPHTLEQHLTKTGVPAGRLTLEITESILMADPERAMEVLLQLKELGIRISIDDFGIGYSSLAYLRQLRFDELKIDKSFVMDLTRPGDGEAIVQAVVEMGHKLGLEVVGEGVETQHALDTLNRFHCDWAQGYYLSRPQSGEELTAWLQSRSNVGRLGHY